MNHDNEKLKAYLLDELSGADAEAYDELSFTDEIFADALSAAENDLIDAYLQNELRGAELEKFETVYLATKHRREKVEFARILKVFSEKEIAETQAEEKKAGFFAAWNIFGGRALQFGFASALLVLFFGVLWFAVLRKSNSNVEIAQQKSPTPAAAVSLDQNINANNLNSESAADAADSNDDSQNTNQTPIANKKNANEKIVNKIETPTNQTPPGKIPISTPRKPIIASIFLAPPVRGGSNIPVFSFPKNASQIKAALQLEADEYDSYHVALTNETGNINLWRANSLKARNSGGNNILNVSFPAKLLNTGFYSLTVSGVNKNGEAETFAVYPFRVDVK